MGGLELIGAEPGAHRSPGGQCLEGHYVNGFRWHGEAISGGVRLDHVVDPGLAQLGPQAGNQRVQRVSGLPGRPSGQISPASEPAGATRPASRASKMSRTRNWRPPTRTGRPVSSRT
jgi:hypothetical protein